MNLKNFKKITDWTMMWSARCCINSTSQLIDIWVNKINVLGKPMYNSPVLVIHRSGVTDCWASQADRDNFGARLIAQTRANPRIINEISFRTISQVDKVFSFIEQNGSKKFNINIYNKFWEDLATFYDNFMRVKYTADYLSQKESKKYLSTLQEARVYGESVLKRQENFMEKMAIQIAEKTGTTKEQILSTTKEELRSYFSEFKLPAKSVLKKRYVESAQLLELGNTEVFTGKAAKRLERVIIKEISKGGINGQVAYEGKATGKVKIVLNPSNYNGLFEKGDILVTTMTRPEFLPFLEKAAAFITDSGGVLSHAAISARELKKPCLIGTKIATKVLRDGDLVEVDADKGIVKILRKNNPLLTLPS